MTWTKNLWFMRESFFFFRFVFNKVDLWRLLWIYLLGIFQVVPVFIFKNTFFLLAEVILIYFFLKLFQQSLTHFYLSLQFLEILRKYTFPVAQRDYIILFTVDSIFINFFEVWVKSFFNPSSANCNWVWVI